MQLAQLILAAIRQLDEDVSDVNEFHDVFKAYANQGYAILVQQVKPRERRVFSTDENGEASLLDDSIVRVVSLTDSEGRRVGFSTSEDGERLVTEAKRSRLDAVCEVNYPDMETDADEPQIPSRYHQAIVDFICYRYLLSGNLAKQSRAQAYLAQFNQQMGMVKPQGQGSVTHTYNLYSASSIHNYNH